MAEVGVQELGRRFELGPDACRGLALLATVLAEDPAAPISAAVARGGRRRSPRRRARRPRARRGAGAGAIADIGSGAGIPALPLAIARPEASVVALEANARKVAFITRAAPRLAARRIHAPWCARAEAWPDGLGRFDLVTARALAPLPVVAEYAAPLLRARRGARRVARPARPRRRAGRAAAADALGLGVEEVRRVARTRGDPPAPPRAPQARADSGAVSAPAGRGPQTPAGRPRRLTASGGSFGQWGPSTRWPTRRVGSARPRPP